VGDHWEAWKLRDGWKTGGRDIGWVESIALELAVLWVVHAGFHDAIITVRCDNTGIIGDFTKGCSHSVPHNDTIWRITTSLVPFNLTINPLYVTSGTNRADPPSRSILGPDHQCLPILFTLPLEVQSFLAHV